ncbi:MAG: MopE-related protein [Myxococcota bacterium]|nr:MopE-related protein [Myxococcota bacterium]
MRLFLVLIVFVGCREGTDKGNLNGRDSGGSAVVDADLDGYPESVDCDDDDPDVHPGAEEHCDGVDEDCDSLVDEEPVDGSTWYADADGDGHGGSDFSQVSCEQPDGYVDSDLDCDDLEALVYPDAPESCDGLDNDCDGAVDEDAIDEGTFYIDIDGDGYGSAVFSEVACTASSGFADNALDCDDADSAIHPGAIEADCSDPVDYNCDGSVGFEDSDADGYAACEDCDDSDPAVSPDASETCDGVDEDCDGEIDNDASDATTLYADSDGDGFGGQQFVIQSCDDVSGYVADGSDCDDVDANSYPGGSEICDGLDNDCDGTADEGVLYSWYQDVDGDGYGDSSAATVEACSAPPGYTANSDDCDDSNAQANPGSYEICDGVDNDCDGQSDEAGALGESTFYADSDADGYGDAASTVSACEAPTSYVSDSGDCDDASASISPAATETCDGVDNNCDGAVDEATAADTSTYYQDLDGDGFGSATVTTEACSSRSGYVQDNTDCNDLDSNSNPQGVEVCDAANTDEDCDGFSDDADPEGAGGTTLYYLDVDGDGYGDQTDSGTGYCDAPGGYSTDNTDCDDSASGATVNPGATETWYDGVDSDCGGGSDYDADGDGYDSNQHSGEDCDDANASSTILSTDADCDGTLSADDCDDSDDTSTTVAADADCDGTITAEDCDDGDSASTTVATDGDCDGILTASDCDDTDPGVSALGSSQDCPGSDCEAILNQGINTDGNYWINPDNGSAFETYCDMNTSGGGWTLAIRGTLDTSYNASKDSALTDSNGFMYAFDTQDFSDVLVKFSAHDASTDWVRFDGVGSGSQTLDDKIQNCCNSQSNNVNYNAAPPHAASARSSSLSGVNEVDYLSLKQSETAGPNDGMFFVLSNDRCYTNSNHRSVGADCVGAMLAWGAGFYSWSNWESYTGWDTGCYRAGYRDGSDSSCTSTGAVFVR